VAVRKINLKTRAAAVTPEVRKTAKLKERIDPGKDPKRSRVISPDVAPRIRQMRASRKTKV
jgi:hypothetical protein